MDRKVIGNVIAKLRRQYGWTQSVLAEKLGVTCKAVSKWESGQGYPDITLFPVMAELFGVTVDFLMFGNEKGITVAGIALVDIVKNIEIYPDVGMLVNVNEIHYAVGGCVPNVSVNLAKIDKRIPIRAIARVGSDDNGRYIVSVLQKYGVDVSRMAYSSCGSTGFCDVMSVPSGERTFFHNKGSNAEFCPSDISLDELDCSLFHIGYVLLMDRFDAEDKQYGTVLAKFLHDVQKRGIRTSIDLVSSSVGNYQKKVIPVLPYCDYVIINEIECCGVWGLSARTADGGYNRENIRLAMQKTMAAGVGKRVVVHCKEACFSMDTKGNFTEVPSLRIPKSDIKGAVGAGDAFCAGCLYAIYHHYDDMQMLEFASAAAACNLLETNAVDGMRSRNEIWQLAEKYGRLSV